MSGLSIAIGPLINENSYPLTSSKGLIVFIHNHTEILNVYSNALSIEPGKETSIMIDRKIETSLPSPYSECVDLSNGHDSEFYQVLTNNGAKKSNYRQFNCFGLCIVQKPIEDSCGCYFTGIQRFRSSTPCTNLTQITCLKNKMSFITNNLQLFLGKCEEKVCPLECDSYEYDTHVTSLDYPSKEFYKLLQINETQSKYNVDLSTYDLFRQYYYSLNFYYSSTVYTYVSESPQMTFVDLLSALGGSLGMFVGLSVFSLLEVFEIIFRLIWIPIADKLFHK
jgi:amiloride-sensitive sodium channel subunit alpha/amiloride-sensitive sodium channel subunit gamma